MTPSIGRIIHYVSFGTPGGEYTSQCRAAIITEVDPTDPQHVGLEAFNPTGNFHHPLGMGGCRYEHPDNGPAGKASGGTWHWPERVEE